MKRIIIVPLFAALSLVLIPLAANARSSDDRTYSVSARIAAGKNHVDYLYYDVSGVGVKTVRMFLVGIGPYRLQTTTSKYLSVLKAGTSRYFVLKKPIIVQQPGGNVKIPAGTKYWVRSNLPVESTPKARITIAVKVRSDIPPHLLQCVRTSEIGTSPASGDTPAYWKFGPADYGYCMSGKQWLTPVVH